MLHLRSYFKNCLVVLSKIIFGGALRNDI